MKLKFAHGILAALLLGLALGPPAWAQVSPDEPDWKELTVPPPPAFDLGKLVTFEVSRGSSLVYGVDPASISVSKADGIVRYVMVASSATGARNVMYEGLRCATGEFRTYARYSPEGGWKTAEPSEWRSLFANMPSRYALRFAQAGGCDNTMVPPSVNVLVSRLKNPNFMTDK